MASDPGHRDQWGAPADGWPSFCSECGRRLVSGACTLHPRDQAYEDLRLRNQARAHVLVFDGQSDAHQDRVNRARSVNPADASRTRR